MNQKSSLTQQHRSVYQMLTPDKVHEFEGREKMLELVQPVQDAYAAELGATELLQNVRGM